VPTATVFVAGSLSIKRLDPLVEERLENIVSGELSVVIGDADGADAAVQAYLARRGHRSTRVYCMGQARHNVGEWPTCVIESLNAKGSRAYYTAKDIAMAEVADYGLMLWDAKSTGTLKNVIELLARNKKVVVFINKVKQFRSIATIAQVETELLHAMAPTALQKAEEKLGLSRRLLALRHEQARMF
jgi:hypothetical protein